MECNLGPIKVRGQNRRKKENINKQIFLFIPYSTLYIVYSLVAIRLRKKKTANEKKFR